MNNKKPVEVIRDGSLAASVWERDGSKGRYFEFTLSRSYKTDDGFAYSGTFHERDAEALMRVVERAAASIRERNANGTQPEDESAGADLGSGADAAPASADPDLGSEESRRSAA